jgi:uncharacterized protein YecE (DUF72 family)
MAGLEALTLPMARRSKFEPINEPMLFAIDKLETPTAAIGKPIERAYDQQADVLVGTSAFTAAGWPGTFYPSNVKPANYLSYYATQFRTVEIDSTYYRTPAASTVSNWYSKTPHDFIFAAKVPQVITHEKVLENCEAEFDEFIASIGLLDQKLGPLLLQFPYFNKYQFNGPAEFLRRLRVFLKRVDGTHTLKFAVEIRNKGWLIPRLADLLREHNIALALTDTSFVPRPWETQEPANLVTADFAYVRWLGDRKGIEETTITWDKTIIDRQADMKNWVKTLRDMLYNKKVLKIFAYANNHYAGHGPATVKLFWDLWSKTGEETWPTTRLRPGGETVP